jgi:hypothetical protein
MNQLAFISLFISCSGMLFGNIHQDRIHEIAAKKNELCVKKAFNFFDLHLSAEEHEILQSLSIITKVPFRMYGNPENKEHAIALYLESLGNSVECSNRAARIIHRFIMDSFNACGFPAISVIMRPTEQTDKFDIARWHIDNASFDNSVLHDLKIKLVCALKGSSTLFSCVSGAARDEFLHTLHDKSFDIQSRENRSKLLASYEIMQASIEQGACFIIGDPLQAAVHSEPPIHEDRLFMAIIPGTVEQIKLLQYLETGK